MHLFLTCRLFLLLHKMRRRLSQQYITTTTINKTPYNIKFCFNCVCVVVVCFQKALFTFGHFCSILILVIYRYCCSFIVDMYMTNHVT